MSLGNLSNTYFLNETLLKEQYFNSEQVIRHKKSSIHENKKQLMRTWMQLKCREVRKTEEQL